MFVINTNKIVFQPKPFNPKGSFMDLKFLKPKSKIFRGISLLLAILVFHSQIGWTAGEIAALLKTGTQSTTSAQQSTVNTAPAATQPGTASTDSFLQNTLVLTQSSTQTSLGLISGPSQPVVTSSVPEATNAKKLTLSGTKEAFTSILINNVQVVARNNATTWTATVKLNAEGNNAFSITAKSLLGKLSTAKVITILRDTVIPIGSLNINSGALYSSFQAVTLNLGASDSLSGINQMSFSTNNVNWTSPEAYASSKTFMLPAGDGMKTVYVKYFDKAGNASAVSSKSILLDWTAPSGTIKVNNGVQSVKQTAVTLNLSAVDSGSGLSKMSFSTDNLTWSTAENYAASKAWTLTGGNGNKTIYVKFLDKAGNPSNPISVTVLLDTMGPVGSININSGAAYTASRTVTLNLSANDAGTGINTMSFSTDNVNWTTPPEAYSAPRTLTLPAGDGPKTVYVKYSDKLGNVGSVYAKSIVLDTALPTGSINIDSGAAYAIFGVVTLNLSAIDSLSGINTMSFSTDNTTWTGPEAYAFSKTFTLPSGDGNKTVYVKYFDKAGNASVAYSKLIFKDMTAPAGSFQINNGASVVKQLGVTLNLSATETGSGLNTMSFSTDNVNWTNPEAYASSKNFTLSGADGNKTVWVKYYDRAGNPSLAYSQSILLDTTIPQTAPGNIIANSVYSGVRTGGSGWLEYYANTADGYVMQGNQKGDLTAFWVENTSQLLNASNKMLRISYVSTTPGGSSGAILLRSQGAEYSVPISFPNTNGQEVGTDFMLPGLASLNGIYEVVLKSYNYTGPLSMTIKQLVILDKPTPVAPPLTVNGSYAQNSLFSVSLANVPAFFPTVTQMRFFVNDVLVQDWQAFATTKNNLPIAANLRGKISVRAEFKDALAQTAVLSGSLFANVSDYLADQNMKYFLGTNPVTAVDAASGYPHEGLNQRGFTQPTDIGFYANLLAEVISGDFVTDSMSVAQAKTALEKVVQSLLTDQASVGFHGLLPWMQFGTNGTRQRANGPAGARVVLGDNVNLSAALGVAIGALQRTGVAGVQGLIDNMNLFLDRQEDGYRNYLFDSAQGTFRQIYYFANTIDEGNVARIAGDKVGTQNYMDEFRSGVMFVTLRYDFPTSVYAALGFQMQNYTLQDGTTKYLAAPYNGGGFQMLWNNLLMPDMSNPALAAQQTNYVAAALDFATVNGLPGFASASYTTGGAYCPQCGISQLAYDGDLYNGQLPLFNPATGVAYDSSVASLYTLGAARMVNPQGVDQFLNQALTQHPELLGQYGLWEGVKKNANGTFSVVTEQISANVLSFMLGVIGKGADNMTWYLQHRTVPSNPAQTLYARMQAIQAPGTPLDFKSGVSYDWTYNSSGGPYQMRTFQKNGSDAIQWSQNLSGLKIKITYIGTAPVNGILELKRRVGNSDVTVVSIDGINFKNTNGVVTTIEIQLPATPDLLDIDKLMIGTPGSVWGNGAITLTGVQAVLPT